jgi:hypothetical protein
VPLAKVVPAPCDPPITVVGFPLVGRAIDRGPVIVVTRAFRQWRVAVPGPDSYSILVLTNQVQTASLGRGNLTPDGFSRITKAL